MKNASSITLIATVLCTTAFPAIGEAIRLVCDFASFSTPKDGLRSGEFGFLITWDNVTNDAFMTGNNGVAPLLVVPGDGLVTYIERVPSGTLNTTTVLSDGHAVHSRHTVMGGELLIPSQYYGICAPD